MNTLIAITRQHGLDVIELRAPDGARATVALHGGHLLSWVPVGGAEQLYLSPNSGFQPGGAIRGGVPVIFPQFSQRGPLQRHGFARTKLWQLVSAEQGADDALVVLKLTDDADTRMTWAHAFELELSVRIAGRGLQIELACENTGETEFSFTTALHTYLHVNDVGETSVEGLSGLRYFDNLDQTEKTQRVDLLLPGGELDRVYYRAVDPLLLREHGISAKRQVAVHQQGFDDVVAWNPGAVRGAALPDMPADGYKNMLCLEAATVARPVNLAAGESWVGRQTFALL